MRVVAERVNGALRYGNRDEVGELRSTGVRGVNPAREPCPGPDVAAEGANFLGNVASEIVHNVRHDVRPESGRT